MGKNAGDNINSFKVFLGPFSVALFLSISFFDSEAFP